MTVYQRKLLEKFAAGSLPLNRAIRAALDRIDRLENSKKSSSPRKERRHDRP